MIIFAELSLLGWLVLSDWKKWNTLASVFDYSLRTSVTIPPTFCCCNKESLKCPLKWKFNLGAQTCRLPLFDNGAVQRRRGVPILIHPQLADLKQPEAGEFRTRVSGAAARVQNLRKESWRGRRAAASWSGWTREPPRSFPFSNPLLRWNEQHGSGRPLQASVQWAALS